MAKAKAQDLITGANWLRAALEDFNCNDLLEADELSHIREAVERCIAFLDDEAERREARSDLAAQKRAYAQAHGIKISQVRVSKKAVA